MIGYKAFDKGLKCRGFQYEVGNVAEELVSPEVCNRGLHFCAKPLDVLNYYDYIPGETEFAEVEAVGDIATEGDKSSTNKLLIKAKLTFWDLFKINFKMVFENVESKENVSSTTGDDAHSSTTGKHSISSAIGIQAKAKVVEGWLVLADWRYNEDSYEWELSKVVTVKVGDILDGVTIEPNVYYFYKDGELKDKQ